MKKGLPIITVAFALCLAACGRSGPSTQIELSMTDFTFAPNQFTVPAGQSITLRAVHEGSVAHSFIIMKAGADAGHRFDEADRPNVYWMLEIQPGQSEAVVFTAPNEPGEYQVLCGMPGHLEAGMIGKLIVVAAE